MEPFSTEWFMDLHTRLLLHFGDPEWWPGDTPFEVAVGAVLTQNTAWSNVERAMANLKADGCLHPRGLVDVEEETLRAAIRPAGYFNQKSRYLRELSIFIHSELKGDVLSLARMPLKEAREKLLSLRGIGPETADSILCYGAGLPVFVVDAYTRRLFSRLAPGPFGEMIGSGPKAYDSMQGLVAGRVRGDADLYNRLHALIVLLGKDICRSRPLCIACPLAEVCVHGKGGASHGPRKNEK
ncbi:MAG: endonuclease III domain-containing protein [Thermoplasmatota archaeon]